VSEILWIASASSRSRNSLAVTGGRGCVVVLAVVILDPLILGLQSRELATRGQTENECDGARREHQGEQAAGQIAEPLAPAPQSRESSAGSPQGCKRGRTQPDGRADSGTRPDDGLHDHALHGEARAIGIHLDQPVRGSDDLFDELEKGLDQPAPRAGRRATLVPVVMALRRVTTVPAMTRFDIGA